MDHFFDKDGDFAHMRLIAALQVDCGITLEQYWSLTWAQIKAYLSRKESQLERQDYRIGGLLLEIRSLFSKTTLNPLSIWPWHAEETPEKKQTNELKGNLASRVKFQEEKKK